MHREDKWLPVTVEWFLQNVSRFVFIALLQNLCSQGELCYSPNAKEATAQVLSCPTTVTNGGEVTASAALVAQTIEDRGKVACYPPPKLRDLIIIESIRHTVRGKGRGTPTSISD